MMPLPMLSVLFVWVIEGSPAVALTHPAAPVSAAEVSATASTASSASNAHDAVKAALAAVDRAAALHAQRTGANGTAAAEANHSTGASTNAPPPAAPAGAGAQKGTVPESTIETGSTVQSATASTPAASTQLNAQERELVGLLANAVRNLMNQVQASLEEAGTTAQQTDGLGQAANYLSDMENDAKSKVDFAVLFGQQQNSMGKQLASQANSQALEIQEERKDVDELHAKSMQMNMAYHQAKSEVEIQSVNLNQMQDDIGRKIARAMTEYKAMNMWASLFSYNTDQLTARLSDTYDNLALVSQLMSGTSSHLVDSFNDIRNALNPTTTPAPR